MRFRNYFFQGVLRTAGETRSTIEWSVKNALGISKSFLSRQKKALWNATELGLCKVQVVPVLLEGKILHAICELCN